MRTRTRWKVPRRLAAIRLPRGDPSRTSATVRAYRRDMNRRWRELNRVLRLMIIRDDVLGLSDTPPRVVLQLNPPGRFGFPADVAGKAEAFSLWLRGALDSELLEIVGGSPTGWQNAYVRASYSVGVQHADRALGAVGITPPAGALAQTFNQPIHIEKLQLLFSRNFNELKGITDAVAQNLSRVVTEGLATGQSPRVVARSISQAINTIGRNRSLVLARTETIRAHATATLARFEQSGVTTVQGFAEFLTAGDDRVCQRCLDLEGTRFKLEEASSIIPVHPSCRCVWLPVLDDKAPKTRPIPTRAEPFAGFVSGKPAAQKLNTRYANTALKDDKFHAVNGYQNGNYGRINTALRNPGGTVELTTGELRQVALLDDTIRNSKTIGADTQVWRGGGTGRSLGDVKVGDVIVDKGYVSTTTNAQTAMEFTTRNDEGAWTVYKIGLPKNTRGVWMEQAIQDGWEDELMLGAGSRFKVVGLKRVDSRTWGRENLGKELGQFGQKVLEVSLMLEP